MEAAAILANTVVVVWSQVEDSSAILAYIKLAMSPRFLRFVADAVGVGAAFGAASSVIVVVTVVVSSSSTRTQAVCNTVVVNVDEGVDDSAGV